MRARAPLTAVAAVTLLTTLASPARAAAPAPRGCDPLDTALCLLPFPNDWYTVADHSTGSGRRVAFTTAEMPRNRIGLPVDPAEFDRNDGFSPGTPILAQIPGLDLARTGAAPVTDIGASLAPDAPIVILDLRTGARVPYWAELDSNTTDRARQALIVHPAVRLTDATHYAVALRDLRTSTGQKIAPTPAFAAMLAKSPPKGRLAARWRELHPVLRALARHGITSRGLDLAWDFTTSSSRSLTERALHMRDESFATLGRNAPLVTISSVKDTTPQQDPQIARRVIGEVWVPNYLNEISGGPGSRLHYATARPGPDSLPEPTPGEYLPAEFQCDLPQAATAHPARPVLFGHGLFQSPTVVDNPLLTRAAQHYDVVFCAADWMGMSTEDLPFLGVMSTDLSLFPSVPDRMQQAYLDFLFLGRWMTHPQGLAANWAFRSRVDTSQPLVYGGYSLGGIEGGALSALARDWHRAWLGVPGAEFSTLLNRSVDFGQFQQIINVTYPDPLTQQVGLAMLQMLWDRGEPDGYLDHLVTNPLEGTPAKQILIQNVYGDHQVANVASQTEARSLGIPVRGPVLAAGRDASGFWGIPVVTHLPYTGSMLTFWDSGSPTPPTGNLPPSAGHDPHQDIANTPAALDQVLGFFTTGRVVDTCSGAPCVAIPYNG